MDFVTNQEIIMAARRNLSDNVWHYLTGGAESETTMRHNRFGLDSLAFRPRVLVDVSDIDPSTTFPAINLLFRSCSRRSARCSRSLPRAESPSPKP
ncbi:MAG: alpha-hydroxy-acid oxidizing protein, partial [Candidatus Binatia bacterium]